jgi:RNA polymerase sigma-70 factor (ECF subfamily)
MTPPTPESDAELLSRVCAGDDAAARELVELHLDRLVGFGYRMLGDAAAAEDVAQEAFLRLWRNADKWRADAPISAWLHRVAHNLCIDRLRKPATVPIDAIGEPADPGIDPTEAIQGAQIAAAIDSAIAALPERQAAAIALVHREGMSNIEAAEILEISVEAVESLLARGRRTLRRQLAGLKSDLEGEL